MEHLVEVLVPIAFFLTLFAILYVYWTTRMKIRQSLIEKGADASLFKNSPSKYSLLKWGIFLVAVAIGVIAGYALSTVINEVAAFFTMIFLFGGVGLIVAHLITNSLSKKEKN
jgi:preprotein translocase subunit SecD